MLTAEHLFPALGQPVVDLTIGGRPAPQGSKNAHAVMGRDGRPIMKTTAGGKRVPLVAMRESSKEKVDAWRGDVEAAAALAMYREGHVTGITLPHLPYEPSRQRAAGEWEVCRAGCGHRYPLAPAKAGRDRIVGACVFTRERPASAPKTIETFPSSTPDLSKLIRSTEDALKTIGLWADDGRVTAYVILAKVYPGQLPFPGAPDLSLPSSGARLLLWDTRKVDPPEGWTPLPIGEL